jgi:hypothetical protein
VAVIGGGPGPSSSIRTLFNFPFPQPFVYQVSRQSPAATVSQGSPVSFSPGQLFLPGLGGVWYDFSDTSTLFQSGTRASPGTPVTAAGQPVGLVLDKSGNGNDLVQATSTKRPLYQADGSLLFDGVDDFLQSTATIDFSAYGQIAAAIGFVASSGVAVLCEYGPDVTGGSAGNFYLAATNDPATGKIDAGITGANSTADGVGTTSTSYGSGITSVISYQAIDMTNASATARLPMRRNGAAETTAVVSDGGSAGTVFGNSQSLYVGARAGSSLFHSGKIFGIFIRGRGLEADEIASLDTWLIAKSVPSGGITGSVSATLGSFLSAAAAKALIHGLGSGTLNNFSSTSVATARIKATASVAPSNFAASSVAKVRVKAAASVTLANFTTAATGKAFVRAASAASLNPFTSASADRILVKGAGAGILSAFSSAAAAQVKVKAAAAPAPSSFATLATAKTLIKATAAPALSAFTAAAIGAARVKVAGSPSLGSFLSTAAAKALIEGVGSGSLNGFAAASATKVRIKAVASPTLGLFTTTAVAHLVTGAITATASPSLSPLAASSAASVRVKATGSAQIGAFVSSASAKALVEGLGSGALNAFTVTGRVRPRISAQAAPEPDPAGRDAGD